MGFSTQQGTSTTVHNVNHFFVNYTSQLEERTIVIPHFKNLIINKLKIKKYIYLSVIIINIKNN